MASRTSVFGKAGTRILWLALAIVVVIAAYTATWFYLARSLEQRANATIAALNDNGVRAFCEEPEARGYPFRIGLFCRGVFYENVGRGVSVRAGDLRSAAQIYQPYRVLAELDGPASVVLPYGAAVEARWKTLRASTRLARPLPEAFSAEARDLGLSYKEGSETTVASVRTVGFHARPQDSDLEVAITFAGLDLDDEMAPGVPPLEGRLHATVDDGVALLSERAAGLRGNAATIRELVVGVAGSDAAISVSGPVSVDDNGLLNGELSVTLQDPAAIARILAAVLPDLEDEIATTTAALSSFGGGALNLRIVRGNAFLGFIPLGEIPPL